MRALKFNVLMRSTALLLACTLVVATCPLRGYAYLTSSLNPPQTADSADRIDQLVAPIALYPDALVAQILAGATYPTQVVEADRWMKQNSKLQGEDLGKAVDKQSWDNSIKALTQFPSVLDNMSKNLSWTSALGDAYFNDQAGVTAAVQKLRKQAHDSGNLKTTKEQTVTTQGQTIVIQPANPQIVYVPTYNPTVVYGTPIPVYPGYSSADLAAASILSFGVGMAVGAAVWGGGGCCGWGWNSWGYNWHGGTVVYNRNVYVSNSNAFVNRNSYYRNNGNYPRPTPYGGNANVNRNGNVNANRSGNANANRSGNLSGNTVNRGGNTVNVNPGGNNAARNQPSQLSANRGSLQGNQARPRAQTADRGYGQTRDPGTRSSAFSGYGAGGNTMNAQSRGRSSYGGGGGTAGARSGAGGGGGGRRR